MKVYLSKAGVFEAPGKQSKGAEKIDVPTDTAGLVDYLNELTSQQTPPQDAIETYNEPLPPPATITQPTLEAIAAKVSAFKATEIEDFILNNATVAQVENIFSCLGCRFAELRKAAA